MALMSLNEVSSAKEDEAPYTPPPWAACLDLRAQLDTIDGKKIRESVDKIMEYSECEIKSNHDKPGKWFCYVTDMVGIQGYEENHTRSSGRIKPEREKFIITVNMADRAIKKSVCERNLGASSDFRFPNLCFYNFEMSFSDKHEGMYSIDGFVFANDSGKTFKLGNKDFTFIEDRPSGTYISVGKCEKIQ